MTDVPADLVFVDPAETATTWRTCLWAAPGQGKSVALASAPAPILVVSADRPSAYGYARKHHGHTAETLREVRYRDHTTLDAVYRYLQTPQGQEIRTLGIDPVSHIVDQLADVAPPSPKDGGTDYQWVNKKMLGFVKSLRVFDINVVLVAHEKLNDGKKGDGKLYPALGGATLINKLLAEMDIVAHIERIPAASEESEDRWIGQIQPRDNLVCKDGTNALGDRRIADLTRWFALATDGLKPDLSDLPFSEDYKKPDAEPAADSPSVGEQASLETPA
jgi:hypothetical protein